MSSLSQADSSASVRVLSEYPGACVAMVDEDLRYLFVSDAKAHLLGVDPESVVGRRVSEFFGEEWEQERRPLVREAVAGAASISLVETIRGWKCVTKIRGIEPDAAGRRRALFMSRPVSWIPGGVNAARAANSGRLIEARHNDGDLLRSLSPTEIDVLRLIGLGLSTEDIAQALHRSRKTVEWHRSSLGRKLGVLNRVELAMIAVRAGLCSMFGEAGAGMAAVTSSGLLPAAASVGHAAHQPALASAAPTEIAASRAGSNGHVNGHSKPLATKARSARAAAKRDLGA